MKGLHQRGVAPYTLAMPVSSPKSHGRVTFCSDPTCSGSGTCTAGTCVCDAGFYDASASLAVDQALIDAMANAGDDANLGEE